MTIENIIDSGEGQRIEFKASFSEGNEAIESLCAFSNSEGGTVLIGVTDSGKVVGTSQGKNTLENFSNNLYRSTEPPLHVSINPEEIDTKKVVAISVKPPRPGELFYAFNKPFIRVGKTNQVMNVSEQRERLLAGQTKFKPPEVFVGFQIEGSLSDQIALGIHEIPLEPNYDYEIDRIRDSLASKYEEEKANQRTNSRIQQRVMGLNQNYLEQMESYLSQYRKYSREKYQHKINSDRLRHIPICAVNRGNQTAEDITIVISLPFPNYLSSEERYLITHFGKPLPPTEPIMYPILETRFGNSLINGGDLSGLLRPSNVQATQQNVRGPSYDSSGDEVTVVYKVRRLVPNLLERNCDPFKIWLREIEEDTILSLKLTVYAANLPEPSSQTITLDVRVEGE